MSQEFSQRLTNAMRRSSSEKIIESKAHQLQKKIDQIFDLVGMLLYACTYIQMKEKYSFPFAKPGLLGPIQLLSFTEENISNGNRFLRTFTGFNKLFSEMSMPDANRSMDAHARSEGFRAQQDNTDRKSPIRKVSKQKEKYNKTASALPPFQRSDQEILDANDCLRQIKESNDIYSSEFK